MPKKQKAAPDVSGMIRIGELARRAGVPKGTVAHYVREGLVPQPVKTFRNMAYYEPEWAERIRLIKQLQSRTRLPLRRIREMIESDTDLSSLAESVSEAQDAALNALTPAARGARLTLQQASEQFGLHPAAVAALCELDIVSTAEDPELGPVFRGADLEVLAALGELATLGFGAETGFEAEDLLMYRDALNALLEREVEVFMRVMAANPNVTPELARAAVDGATLFLLALRKKTVADYLSNFMELVDDGATSEKRPSEK